MSCGLLLYPLHGSGFTFFVPGFDHDSSGVLKILYQKAYTVTRDLDPLCDPFVCMGRRQAFPPSTSSTNARTSVAARFHFTAEAA